MYRKIILINIALILTACANVNSGEYRPPLGMTFKQPYPFFVGGGNHDGLDINVRVGTPVRSIADGKVAVAHQYNLKGNLTNIVLIYHKDGITSRYIHIDKVSVKEGDTVKQGQQFAVTAMNGPAGPNTNQSVTYPHLHLEIYKYGELIDPLSLKMSCKESIYTWPVGC